MEVELKLLLDAVDFARIGRTGTVSRARRGRGRYGTLHTIYYDTPEQLLRRNRVVLRLRRSGRRWIQTVKGAGGEIGGLHRREEIEWSVPAGELNLELLADTPFAKLFSRTKIRTRLAPAFATVFRRRSIELQLQDGATAWLCLDKGEIQAGAVSDPICEAEIELVLGDAVALLDFAGSLLGEIPFRVGTQSNAERGYALAALNAGAVPGPVRAQQVAMTVSADAREAFSAIIEATSAQFHANEQGFIGQDDPEYLHQLRVGLRRLRVALALPREEEWENASRPLRVRLRELSRHLGEARNWDVFIHEMLQPMSAHCGAKFVAGLRRRAARRRAAALGAAREAIQSRGTTQLWLDLARLVAGWRAGSGTGHYAREMATEAVTRRFRRLTEFAAKGHGGENLHELRITAKKLRYVCEFFAGLYPRKKVKRFLAELTELQDTLGLINDAAIGQALVARVGEGARPLDAHIRGFASGWIAAGRARALRGIEQAVKAPLEAGVFWKQT